MRLTLVLLALCGALAAAEPRRAKGRTGAKRPNFKIVEEDPRAPKVTVSKEDASNREGKGTIRALFLLTFQASVFLGFSVLPVSHRSVQE